MFGEVELRTYGSTKMNTTFEISTNNAMLKFPIFNLPIHYFPTVPNHKGSTPQVESYQETSPT